MIERLPKQMIFELKSWKVLFLQEDSTNQESSHIDQRNYRVETVWHIKENAD